MTIYVYSGAGGSNTGADWTNAYTSYGSAVSAVSNDEDILVHYTHQEDLSADTTWAFAGGRTRTISVDKDNSDAYTPMGSNGYIGHATLNRSITIQGANNKEFWGITFTIAGSTSDDFIAGGADGSHSTFRDCIIDFTASNVNGSDLFLMTSGSIVVETEWINCTLAFGTNTSIQYCGGKHRFVNCTLSGNPDYFVEDDSNSSTVGGLLEFIGCDLSSCTSTLVAEFSTSDDPMEIFFHQCKLGSGVTLFSTTHNDAMGLEVTFTDCSSGDTHMSFAHYSFIGTITADTGITFDSSSADYSWKIVTSSYAHQNSPFITPWISKYNTSTATVTPYLEILRDGSATAYQDDEVFLRLMAKVTSGYTKSTMYTDSLASPVATPANQANGAGTGSWTGEAGTAWSGKVDSGSSLAPAEIGEIMAQLWIPESSITVYVNPEILT